LNSLYSLLSQFTLETYSDIAKLYVKFRLVHFLTANARSYSSVSLSIRLSPTSCPLVVTGCHLPYGIRQCYLLPDASEHFPP